MVPVPRPSGGTFVTNGYKLSPKCGTATTAAWSKGEAQQSLRSPPDVDPATASRHRTFSGLSWRLRSTLAATEHCPAFLAAVAPRPDASLDQSLAQASLRRVEEKELLFAEGDA